MVTVDDPIVRLLFKMIDDDVYSGGIDIRTGEVVVGYDIPGTDERITLALPDGELADAVAARFQARADRRRGGPARTDD